MKQKVFTLLALLLVGISGAWADEYKLVNDPEGTPTLTTDFHIGALSLNKSTAITIDDINFKKAIGFGSTLATIHDKEAGDNNICYDIKTTTTKFTVYVGGATGTLYFSKIAEGATSTTVENKTISSNPQKIEFTLSSTTNTRVGFSLSNTSIYIYQIIAEETGTAHKQAGDDGYELNLNKGRYAGYKASSNSGKSGKIDNIEIVSYNKNTHTNTSALELNKNTADTYIKFTTGTSPNPVKVTFGAGTLILNTTASTTGGETLTSGTAKTLSASTTYYIINTNSGNRASITKIAFETPDVTAPVLDTENSVPADGATDVAVAGTIVLKFNEAIAAVDDSKFSLNNGGTVSSVAIDGTDNTKVNVVYTGLGYFANTTLTIAAGGFEDTSGNANASAATLSFKTMKETAATPVISPADGSTFSSTTQSITITCATDGATIYYTIDGTTPTSSSTEYSDAFTISSTTTIKAIAIKADVEDSDIASATITKVVATPWNSWDFTSWSSETIDGTGSDSDKWYDHEKSDGSGVDFSSDKGAVNKTAASGTLQFGSTNIKETDGLTFTADAYQMALVYNVSHALNDYHGNQYIWLFKSTSTITIPSVPANATIEIGVETHKATAARGVTLKNGSTTLERTMGAETSTDYQVCKWNNTSTAGDVTITPSAGLHIYYITVTANVETVPVKTNASRNYGTMVTPAGKKLDFSAVADDVKAYISPGLNAGKTAISIQSVGVVPANTPIIIKTTTQGATVDVPVTTEDADDIASINKLVAGDGSTDATPGEYTYFYIASDQFHQATGGTLTSGKAYLKLETATLGHELTFGFDESENSDVTGISEVKTMRNAENGDFFNLNGQRVNASHKGIVIVNGKKFLNK